MLPLEGIKVIDLSRLAPGPYGTTILGDLGAEVIKIEEPWLSGRRAAAAGASSRSIGVEAEERAAALNPFNRNKQSITLDLKKEGARKVFQRMVVEVDVLVEGFRPGVARRLGADYETVSQLNPRLIYCSITGYGQDGPYRDVVGHDLNYISLAGALGLIGRAGQPPTIPHNFLADFAGGGMTAAIAILAALFVRERTGRGQYLDISMMDGAMALLAPALSRYLTTGQPYRRGESFVDGGAPYYNIYQTKDGGYISIGCIEPWLYENLCRSLGREDLTPLQYAEGEEKERVFAAFREVFLTRTRDEWFELLKDKDVCIGKVYTLEEAMKDPQARHREMVLELGHPTLGKVVQIGIPFKFSETPAKVRSLGTPTGADTEKVLKQLGYTSRQIADLRKEGAIK